MCASCAEEMVEGVCDLLGADAAVSVTGVGGPDEEEGEPPGTVFIGTRVHGRTEVTRHQFEGEPDDVLDQTTDTALTLLAARLMQPPA
jgi:nicotinamide-nucleotide amidase